MNNRNHKPLLSICIPTFNRAELLKTSLVSLIPQIKACNGEVELIISDNNSPDHTEEVVKSAINSSYIRYHKNSENIGAVKNILLLVNELAEGEYCWVIGDDDMINQDKIIKILNIIKKHPHLDYFYVNYYCKSIDDRNKLILEKNSCYIPTLEECMSRNWSEVSVVKWEEILEFDCSYLPGMFTAVVCHILRRSCWIDHSKLLQVDGKTFSSLDTTYPHLKIIALAMVGKPVYYIGDPCLLLGQGSQEWSEYIPLLHFMRLYDALELYEQLGIDEHICNLYKKKYLENSVIYLAKFMVQPDIVGKEYFSLEKFFKRFGTEPILWNSLTNNFRQTFATIKQRYMYPTSVLTSVISKYIKEGKKIVIWGSGEIGQNLIDELPILKERLFAVVDGNSNKHGDKFYNTDLIIRNPEYLLAQQIDVIIIATIQYVDEILEEILNKHNLKAAIVCSKGIFEKTEDIRSIIPVKSEIVNPDSCSVYMTDVCNFKCAGCSRTVLGVKNFSEMKLETVQKLLSIYPTINSFCIAGLGEPTLCSNFVSIVDYLKENNKIVGIITNGSNVEKLLELKYKPDYISISLYGANEDDYLSYCGINMFDSVISNYKKLKETYDNVGFSYIVNKNNYSKLESILQLCDELNPQFLDLVNYLAYGYESQQEIDKIITMSDINVINYVNNLCNNRKYIRTKPYYPDFSNDMFYCNSYNKVINVDGNGNISGCQRQIAPSCEFGNIFKDVNPFNTLEMLESRRKVNNSCFPHKQCKFCFGRFIKGR